MTTHQQYLQDETQVSIMQPSFADEDTQASLEAIKLQHLINEIIKDPTLSFLDKLTHSKWQVRKWAYQEIQSHLNK